MRTTRPLPRPLQPPLGAVLAAIGCAAALAACGSSGSGSGTTAAAAATKRNAGIKFAQCMRSHGVPNFPDPGGSGRGIHINISPGSGVNPQAPAFQAAQKSCQKLLPGGGPGNGHPTEQDKLQMLHTAQCMRSHGISNFPDPTTHPPTPGQGGPTAVLGRDGEFLVIPSSISTNSPAFQRAAAACHFPMPGRGRTAPAP